MANYISTPDTFFIGDYAEFLFITDQVVAPSDVSVFQIQYPLPASITGTNREPFCCVAGSSLSIAADGNVPAIIQFCCGIYTALDAVSFINSFVSGVSGISGGFTAIESNGFVTLQSNTSGFTSSLVSSVANVPLGIHVAAVIGSDQQKIPLNPQIVVNTIDVGEVAVTFPIADGMFDTNQVYYLQLKLGTDIFIKRFKVIPGDDYVSVNFVG